MRPRYVSRHVSVRMRSMASASSGVALRTFMRANPRLAAAMLGDWATFFLALLLIPVLLIEETSSDVAAVAAATAVNAAIWVAFAVDYAVDVWRASDRRGYIGDHWADLALIVVSPPLFVPPEAQALRVLRAL